MERLLTEKLYCHMEETVKVQGWIHRIRKMGKIAFLIKVEPVYLSLNTLKKKHI